MSMEEIITKWREIMEVNRKDYEDENLSMFNRRLALGKFYAYRDCIKDLKKLKL